MVCTKEYIEGRIQKLPYQFIDLQVTYEDKVFYKLKRRLLKDEVADLSIFSNVKVLRECNCNDYAWVRFC